jgi:hypothetical protein
MKKPTILLYWNYNRAGWVKIFECLKDDFDFVYLSLINKHQELNSFTDCSKIYWSDFKNASDIIDTIKPVKVVFMGIDGPLAILLNSACRKEKIPTCMLQHGIFHPYKAYLQEEKLERASRKVSQSPPSSDWQNVTGSFAKQFFLNSIKIYNVRALLTIIKLKLLKKLFGSEQKALYYARSGIRKADKYIVFTKFSSTMLVDRDGIEDFRFFETGNPEADDIIRSVKTCPHSENTEKYFLLIDDPLAEVKEYDTSGFISKDQVNNFHAKVNEYALQNGKRLKIKLHPYSYDSDFFILHSNIDYVKDADLASLIGNSDGVFGVLSTLLIPALFVKPGCVFKFNDEYDLHKFLVKSGYCKVLNYSTFLVDEIELNNHKTQAQNDQFIKAYLYQEDGNSLERIKKSLQS